MNIRISPCLFALFALPVFMPAVAAVITGHDVSGDDAITASYRYWHEPSDTLLDEARVTFSPNGLRVEQLTGDTGNTFIANYADDALWFVDRKRQLFHAVPVVVSTPESPSHSSVDDRATPSIIQVEPCIGLEGELRGESIRRGRLVEHWLCTLNGDLIEEQWYANSPGVVVRTRSIDGFVSELTDIHRRHATKALFSPPSHYRAVGIEELINPAVPISSYNEEKNGQP